MDKIIKALEFFKAELKNGKCSDECVQCNAYEIAIKVLEKELNYKNMINKFFKIEERIK